MKTLKKLLYILPGFIICLLLLCACGAKQAIEAPAVTEEPTAIDYSCKLVISEVMVKNRGSLRTEDGSFPDWIELHNRSDESIGLAGFTLSDDSAKVGWAFPDISLAPGEFLLVYADSAANGSNQLCADFAISYGEELCLISPDGSIVDSLLCQDWDADFSAIRCDDNSFTACSWPSPGYANDTAGYDAYAASLEVSGPIIINEAAVYCGEDMPDWIELKNISDSDILLSDYFISDDHKNYQRLQLPARILPAGQTMLFNCDDEAQITSDFNIAFSLAADTEQLFLSHSENGLIDYISLHDIPLYGSAGRMDGENGYFYFAQPSPGTENTQGMRRISQVPTTNSPDGVFENADSLSVELSGKGKIYYSTDGSYPTEQAQLYTGPLTVSKTSVIRAISIEDGALPSRPLTLSYIINEGHELPVVSLVVDDLTHFNNTYDSMKKDVDIPASVAFYEKDGSFKKDCFTSLKGWTSLTLPKKSLGVSFKSALGGDLEYDVFDNGISCYSTLAIRAGQDYTTAVIRNELFQELALEMDSSMLTQRSKYCVLYINGEYRGLYCLKEDFSKQYYASHAGVTKDSVEFFRAPAPTDVDFFQDVFMFCWHNDLSISENYELICHRLDIDSLIDWFIMEGYSGNTDTQGNLRLFRSAENGNKWTFAFYDIDWSFINPYNAYTLLINGGANVGGEMPTILWSLLSNADFKERLIARYAEVYDTVLSDENVLAKIDELAAIVEPEIARDRQRWNLEAEKWYEEVEVLRSFIKDNDYQQFNLDKFCSVLHVSDDMRAKYFG